MKKFLINIFIFLGLLFVCDRLTGWSAEWMERHSKSGQSLKNHEIADIVTPDILILGSSRSTHHYDPSILKDSLNRTVYIAGQDGNGIIMMWPVFRHISNRNKPQTLIYDLTSAFDLYDDDPQKYQRYLRPLWGKSDVVDSIISLADPCEQIKLASHTYRYNSSYPSLLKGLLPGEIYVDGYSPLYGTFTTGNEGNTATSTTEISSLKLKYFDDMMLYAVNKNIEILFVISPTYYGIYDSAYDIIKDKAEKRGFRVADYSCDTAFVKNPLLFKDPDHLNADGASKLTREIIKELQ